MLVHDFRICVSEMRANAILANLEELAAADRVVALNRYSDGDSIALVSSLYSMSKYIAVAPACIFEVRLFWHANSAYFMAIWMGSLGSVFKNND